jgi:hypothetical protein
MTYVIRELTLNVLSKTNERLPPENGPHGGAARPVQRTGWCVDTPSKETSPIMEYRLTTSHEQSS